MFLYSLDEKKGVPVGKTYINDKQCREFIRSIATIERGNTEELIKDARFVGLLMDRSTDSSVKEEELLYIQTCTEGRVAVRFAGIDAVEKADAEHISGLMDSVDEECICLLLVPLMEQR